jgi:hypothetical protein
MMARIAGGISDDPDRSLPLLLPTSTMSKKNKAMMPERRKDDGLIIDILIFW